MAERVKAPVTAAVVPPTPLLVSSSKPLLQRKCVCGESIAADDKCEECKKKDGMLQRRRFGGAEPPPIPRSVYEVLHSPGQPLDMETRAFFELRFGRDFSQVRIHKDALAAESARAVNALAYTVGRDIVFATGRFAPAMRSGESLIAHELVHVMQHSPAVGAPVSANDSLQVGDAEDAAEQEAERISESAMRMGGGAIQEPPPTPRASSVNSVVTIRKQSNPSPLDDPKRYDTTYQNLFVQAPTSGGASGAALTPWSATADAQIKKEFKDFLKKDKQDNPGHFTPFEDIPKETTQSNAESDAQAADKQLQKKFPQITGLLTPATISSRVHVFTKQDVEDPDFLKQWLSNRLNSTTNISQFAIKEKSPEHEKLLKDLLDDSEAGPLIRRLASHQSTFVSESGGVHEISLSPGVPEDLRKAILVHELVHFHKHPRYEEWVNETVNPRFYNEGFTEWLAQKAMTPDQLAKAKTYDKQRDAVETEVATFVPEDDIARAYFLGEVWRIEGKSKVAKKAFKEQTGLDPDGKRKEENKESQEVAGIVEIVKPEKRYRFMNLGNEEAAPKQEHVDAFTEIFNQFIKNDPTARVQFVGHASSPGTAAFNDSLSLQRAMAFYQMARTAGVPDSQLIDAAKPLHFGKSQPTAGNEDVRGRAFNRRVELFLTHVAPASNAPPPPGTQQQQKQEEENELQRAAVSPDSLDFVPPLVHEVLRSPGKPLDKSTRDFFETRFGHDFGRVRIHSDRQAAESAQAVNALAYTVGQHVAFGQGLYSPETPAGRSLLAHELTHFIQQQRAAIGSSPPVDLEREAEAAASAVSTRSSTSVSQGKGSSRQLQRAPDPSAKHPDEKPTPAEFIKKYSSLFGLKFDTNKIASDLYLLAWQSPDHYKFVLDVFKQLDAGKRIEVADAFFRQLSDETLKDLAKTPLGPSLMKAIAAQLPKENSQRWRAEKAAVQGPQEEREKERTEKQAALKKRGKTVDITIYTKYKGMDTAESLSESVAKGREARKETDVSFPMEEFDDVVAVLEEIAKQRVAKAFVRQLRLIGHGTKDQFGFGRDMYSSAYLKKNYKTGALAEYMADGATVALEGCDVAAGDAGLNYLGEIGRIFFGEKKSGYLKGNTCKALVIIEMTECGPRTLRWPSDFNK